jgi:hypothetical protein
VRFVTSSNERHAKFAARLLSCANPEQGLPEEAVEVSAFCEDCLYVISYRSLVHRKLAPRGGSGPSRCAYSCASPVRQLLIGGGRDPLRRHCVLPRQERPRRSQCSRRGRLPVLLINPILTKWFVQEEEGPEWVDDDKLWPELRARIAAVKFCRNRCLAHGGTEGSLVIAEPVLRMLISILFNMGSLAVEAEDEYVPL